MEIHRFRDTLGDTQKHKHRDTQRQGHKQKHTHRHTEIAQRYTETETHSETQRDTKLQTRRHIYVEERLVASLGLWEGCTISRVQWYPAVSN